MLECQSCGMRFSRPRLFWESRGCCFGLPAREKLAACPRCGGAYIDLGGDADGY